MFLLCFFLAIELNLTPSHSVALGPEAAAAPGAGAVFRKYGRICGHGGKARALADCGSSHEGMQINEQSQLKVSSKSTSHQPMM